MTLAGGSKRSIASTDPMSTPSSRVLVATQIADAHFLTGFDILPLFLFQCRIMDEDIVWVKIFEVKEQIVTGAP